MRLATAGADRVVFGVYDLGSRRVRVPLATSDDADSGVRLVEAPAGEDEFRQLATQVAGSPLIRRLLGV